MHLKIPTSFEKNETTAPPPLRFEKLCFGVTLLLSVALDWSKKSIKKKPTNDLEMLLGIRDVIDM